MAAFSQSKRSDGHTRFLSENMRKLGFLVRNAFLFGVLIIVAGKKEMQELNKQHVKLKIRFKMHYNAAVQSYKLLYKCLSCCTKND